MTKIILASASERRQKLLEQVGINCEVIPSNIDEDSINGDNPGDLVEKLSSAKAENVAERLEGDFVIVAADTVVVKDSRVFGKPSDEKEAFEMLNSLQGNRHEVFTGVTLICVTGGEGLIDTFHVRTIVDMMPMTPKQINAYIQSGEPMDKAGGYGIQGRGAAYIRDVAGDFFNVVGLPISTVLSRLEHMGINLYS
ncbi:MAG: Maf family protein [Lachnospiraceae bacterium]|nr:Maf family protein [Lachnospiraceae bacterium]